LEWTLRLEGRLERDGGWWLAAIPALDAMTQARTRSRALAMVVDLLETMVDRPGFSARVHPGPGRTFEVSGSDVGAVVDVLLRRARLRSGRSLADVTELLAAVDCELVLRETST
jgi:hypothetical protein